MKKAIFTLAVLMMAFGNVGLAQHKTNLKSNATQNVFKHYGVRNETTVVPQVAEYHAFGSQFRDTYTYDEYDYYLIEEYTEMEENGVWNNFGLKTYEYDFSGNVLEKLVQSVDNNGDWVNYELYSYTYENDLLSEVVLQEWNEGGWVNKTKEVYNYNGDVSTVLYWDWNGSNWSTSNLYTYTRSGNTIELLMQYMQGGAWQNEEKCTYTLDFDENILEILVEFWVNNTMWEFHQKNVYHYNGGVYTSMTVEVDNDLVVERYDYSYVDGNATHGECKIWTGGSQLVPGDGNMEMAYGYNAASKTFYGTEVDMTYVDLTGVNENAQANFKVYPVPAEDKIFIQAESFQKAEIYNLTGQKLMESVQETMNVSQLASGVYLLKVYNLDGNSQAQRIVVR